MTGFGLFFFWSFVVAVSSRLTQQENYDYCDGKFKLCDPPADHTMCRFPAPGLSSRCTPSMQEPLSPTEKKRILFWHNKFRSNVANGSERNKNRKLPTAANMRQLYWDDELERMAARWADQCVSSMDGVAVDKCRNTKRFFVSQNVGTRRVNGSTIDKQAPQMVISWYKESKNFDPVLVDKFLPLDEEKTASKQFANMIWAETFALGCARIIFQEEAEIEGEGSEESRKSHVFAVERLVCNYGPGGNEVGKPIYKRGASCAECPEGTECSLVFPGLCALRGSGKQEEPNAGRQEVKNENSSKAESQDHSKKEYELSEPNSVNVSDATDSDSKISESGEEAEGDGDGSSASPGETYSDEDGEAEDLMSRLTAGMGTRSPVAAAGDDRNRAPSTHGSEINSYRIEEIINSPKSPARLLFEAFGKKGAGDERDNEIIYNKNRKKIRTVTNGKKVVREVKPSGAKLKEVTFGSDGKRCKCMEVMVSGGEAFFSKKTFIFYLVASLILEHLNCRQ